MVLNRGLIKTLFLTTALFALAMAFQNCAKSDFNYDKLKKDTASTNTANSNDATDDETGGANSNDILGEGGTTPMDQGGSGDGGTADIPVVEYDCSIRPPHEMQLAGQVKVTGHSYNNNSYINRQFSSLKAFKDHLVAYLGAQHGTCGANVKVNPGSQNEYSLYFDLGSVCVGPGVFYAVELRSPSFTRTACPDGSAGFLWDE